MTRSTKIVCGVLGGASLSMLIGVGVIVYFIVGFTRGISLSNEAYAALSNYEYDIAIARYDAALRKPIGPYYGSYARLNRAVALGNKQRFDEAIRDNSEALRLNPNLAPAFAGRGWCYQQKGEIDKAMADFDKAISLDPNSQYAHYNRGTIFYNRKEITRAIADFDEVVRCEPNHPDGFYMRGLCYAAEHDLDRALSNFDAAIMVDPNYALAFSERAHIYEQEGERAKSIHDLAEAGRLSPPRIPASTTRPEWRPPNPLDLKTQFDFTPLPSADLQPRSDMSYSSAFFGAQLASSAGDFDRAIELNNAVLAMNISAEQASTATMNRGNAYRAKNDWEKAMRDYDEALKLNSKNWGAYVDRASILSHYGEHGDAIKDLDEAIRINPHQWEAYFNRAADYQAQNRLEDALSDLERVIKSNPTFPGAYINRGVIYLRKAQPDVAIDDCNKAIELDPSLAAAYLNLAKAHLRKKQYQSAEQDLTQLTQIKSKNADETLNLLAWFRATCPVSSVRHGSSAIETARKACELSEWKKWGFIDTLAAAYAETGNFDEAVKYQTRAIKNAPPKTDRLDEMKKRLALYQHHKPYREEIE